MDPEGYCRAFKLHLGEKEPVLPRSDETAESLAARFLRHVKEECEQSVFHGEAVTTATITVPVSFAPARKASLKRAAETAGFSSVFFLPEPEAAGTAFLRDNPADKFSRALVLDWGGGTLDIAIISRDEDGTIHADRHCAEGRDDVGGEEMDRGLFENLKVLWKQSCGAELLAAEENEPKLLRESEKVKIGLSRKDTVPFRQGKNKIEVTRDQFRQIVGQLLDAAVELVQSALSKNKSQGDSAPDAILLIGGTSQSPIVRETMEKNFPGLRVLSWHHSHEAVAIGATALPKPETAKASPPEEKTDSSLTSETSFQVDLRGSASKKNADAPFKLTDEVLALAEKVAVCDRPICAEERRFIENRLRDTGCPDPTIAWHKWGTKPEWQLPSAVELAEAAATSLGSNKDNLLKCLQLLEGLAATDGPMTPEEAGVIKIFIQIVKVTPADESSAVSGCQLQELQLANEFWSQSSQAKSTSNQTQQLSASKSMRSETPTVSPGVKGAIVGGVLGSFIPIPGIGTAVGALVGFWAGDWIDENW